MISLATIWLKTGLMPRWLVAVSYLVALGLLIAGDVSMWLTLAFPVWVLVVSALILLRAGYIDEQRAALGEGEIAPSTTLYRPLTKAGAILATGWHRRWWQLSSGRCTRR